MPEIAIEQAMTLAFQHYQEGRLPEAEKIYRQILSGRPNHPEALHMLGAIAHAVGQHQLGVDFMQRSIASDSSVPDYHNNLGAVFQTMGKYEAAVTCFQNALKLKPNYPEACNNLGNTLREQGRHDAALNAYRHAIRLKPDFADAYYNLGILLANNGQWDAAIDAYRAALRCKPDYAAAYSNLGNVLKKKGLLNEAINAYHSALQLKPDYAEAYNNLGNALQDQNRFQEAVDAYHTALRIKPDDASVHNNLANALRLKSRLQEALGEIQIAIKLKPDLAEAQNNLANILLDLGRLDDAIPACRKAIELRPDYAEAHNNLGNIFMAQGRLDEAAAAQRAAIGINPNYSESFSNLGNVLNLQRRPDEAIAAYREAIRLKPDLAEAYCNLGAIFTNVGLFDQAIAACRKAIEIKPDCTIAHDNLLFALHYHPDYDSRAIYKELVQWNAHQAEPLKPFILPHNNNHDPDRRLKIGYVSADFGEHACGLFLEPLLRSHNHQQFEIFCYAQIVKPDKQTPTFQSYADQWRSSVGLSDQQFADQVRRDGIDILVDLKLHTNDNRLLVFARKPAPVQVTWLGYPGSTGLSAIDYRLTDPYLDPPGQDDEFYSEKSIRLPDCFWCYDPLTNQPQINELPALQNGFISFGCPNNSPKINQGVLELWIPVLCQVKHSRLIILSNPGEHRRRIINMFQANGIDSSRVEFLGKRSRLEYLKLYHRMDIVLDTTPYNGHTTNFDALWMGVPVVSLSGQTVVGRAGRSILTNLGLTELIAETPEQYVEIAVKLAGDLPGLTELRSTLRRRMESSPLMDAQRFTQNMESIYRDIWWKWCSNAT
jgi:protein O-GlcNAc transferase